jgi:flavin-dependent dehydrogenase
VEFEMVVGADGAYSTVARAAGLSRSREILVALQAEVRVELRDWVEVHFGVVPDFFAWAVPEKEGIAKVGLATAFGRQALPRLRYFLGKKFHGCEVISVRSGLIPIGPPQETSRAPRHPYRKRRSPGEAPNRRRFGFPKPMRTPCGESRGFGEKCYPGLRKRVA